MISRRKLLETGALVLPTAALTSSLFYGRNLLPNSVRKVFRLVPVEDYAYADSFLAFMRRARFRSVEAAFKAVRNQEVPFRIELVEEA